jgi:hypothetical protein
MLDPARQLLNPSRRPLQSIYGANIERKITVQNRYHVVGRYILGQDLAAPRRRATVAPDEDIKALLHRNAAKVLVWGLSALSHAI